MEQLLQELYVNVEDLNKQFKNTHVPKWNLHSSKDQAHIKAVFQNFTEEVCELLEHHYRELDRKEYQHEIMDEFIDVFNFYTLIMIGSGFKSDIICNIPWSNEKKPFDSITMKWIYQLGITVNILKNRPWKFSQHLTDETSFRDNLKTAYLNYLGSFKLLVSEKALREAFERGYNKNLTRLKSNY